MKKFTEEQHLHDLISFAKVKQHEQNSSIKFIEVHKVEDFARGNKHAWQEIENKLKARLERIKGVTFNETKQKIDEAIQEQTNSNDT